jgi:hypothetical protein
MTFTRIIAIVAVTAVVFYFGLNLLFPRSQGEQKSVAAVTPDQVFSSNSASTPTPPPDSTPAAPAAATESSSSAAPAAAEQPASAAAATPASTGSEAAASGGAASAPPPAQALSADDARKIAQQIGVSGDNGQKAAADSSASAGSAASESAAASSSSGSAAQQTAAESAPAAPAAAEPAPAESAPAESAAATPPPAPEHAPKKSRHAESAAVASAPATPAPAQPAAAKSHSGRESTDAISVWWPAVGQQKSSQLNLLYAGEAAFEKAAVLLFSDSIGNASSAASHIRILNDQGKPVPGHWELSPQNSRMLIFKTRPGRYTLILAPDLAGQSGKTLGVSLHGPVYVH